MKIVQILPELNAGGVEGCVLTVAAYLASCNHESVVISNGGRLVANLEKAGSRHIQLPVHHKAARSLLQVRALRKILAQERPDVLHVHSRVPGWLAWLAWRGMDPTTRPRLVSTVHGFYSVNCYSAIMTRGERVIAVSESIREYILKNYPKTHPTAIRKIFHGIEQKSYHADFRPSAEWLARWRKDHPQIAARKTLLLPGRITRLKGHEQMLQLIASLKREGLAVCGLIAGDTHPKKRAYLQELMHRIRELNLTEDIIFLGHRSDIREIMAVSDVILALSKQPESFGLTVLEALALGRPVVGFDCGGVGELLTAIFPVGKVPSGDLESLTAITRAMLFDDPRPSPVGIPFTLDATCHSTLAVYRELAR